MWLGPLHDPDFVGRVQESVERDRGLYGTAPRMKGMLTLAKEVRGSVESSQAGTHVPLVDWRRRRNSRMHPSTIRLPKSPRSFTASVQR